MKNFLVVFFMFLANSYVINAEEDGAPPQIINGHEAVVGAYMFQASLRSFDTKTNSYIHRCGGSLIHHKWILTAAHCCYTDSNDPSGPLFNTKDVIVVLRAHYIDHEEIGDEILPVDEIIPHPQWHKDYLANGKQYVPNDIALWNLKFGTLVIPVDLPWLPWSKNDDELYLYARDVTITGWGRMKVYTFEKGDYYIQDLCGEPVTSGKIKELVNRNGTSAASCGTLMGLCDIFDPKTHNCLEFYVVLIPNALQVAHVPVIRNCPQPHTLCVGNNEIGACQGDSGGPLFQVSQNPILGNWYIQLGVTSWAPNKCRPSDGASYYTRVSDYMDWINNTMGFLK